jgi:hypothetical protein
MTRYAIVTRAFPLDGSRPSEQAPLLEIAVRGPICEGRVIDIEDLKQIVKSLHVTNDSTPETQVHQIWDATSCGRCTRFPLVSRETVGHRGWIRGDYRA